MRADIQTKGINRARKIVRTINQKPGARTHYKLRFFELILPGALRILANRAYGNVCIDNEISCQC